MSIDLKKSVPPIIRTKDLWADFLDTVSTELGLFKTEIASRIMNLNIDDYTDKDELIDLARAFGYIPILTLDNTLSYLKKEVNSIVYKIKNKGTYGFYNYIFKLIPYTGQVYTFYYDDLKMIRAMDLDTTVTELALHTDYSVPFKKFTPVFHHSLYLESFVTLDESRTLDESPVWYLDQRSIIKPTKHLSLEYCAEILITEGGIEYLMTPTYFEYLEKSANYGRKVTDTTHTGVQLNLIVEEDSNYWNYFYPSYSYSIPTLKTKCQTTSFYNKTRANTESFYKTVAGIGTKDMGSIAYSGIRSNLLLYLPFDEHRDDTIYDDSSTLYEGTVNGTYSRVVGRVGKCISFNGVSTEAVISSFATTYTDLTISFLMKGDSFGQLESNARLIYQSGAINIYYNKATSRFSATLIGGVSSQTVESIFDIDGVWKSICIEVDKDGDMMLYINNDLKDTKDVSAIGDYSSSNNLYIGSQNGSSFFRGLIDEVRIYGKVLGSSLRDYLYSTRPGSQRFLSQKVYSKLMGLTQKETKPEWKLVFDCIPASTVSDERLGIGDGSTNLFTGILSYNDIMTKFFKITYSSLGEEYEVTSDNSGTLVGDRAEGSIDFDTGQYSLTTYKNIDIEDEIASESIQVSNLSYTTDYPIVVPGSFSITYQISDTVYTATDDGLGGIAYTGITSGAINYTTGLVTIVFTVATDLGENITCSYTYTAYSTPDNNSNITAEYKINIDLNLTEVGIEDIDGNLIAYATFPPVKFNSRYNHLAYQFCFKR